MPAAKPVEFRRRAVELAREGDKPVAQIARDLGISESGLRRWMTQAEVDEVEEALPRGGKVGSSTQLAAQIESIPLN